MRVVLGIGVPLRLRAFAAAAGDTKSTKQYPALLLLPTLDHSNGRTLQPPITPPTEERERINSPPQKKEMETETAQLTRKICHESS